MDYIVHRMFGRDAQGAFPVWLRYMILHYSGLRYVNANSSYYPREYILIDLRSGPSIGGYLAATTSACAGMSGRPARS